MVMAMLAPDLRKVRQSRGRTESRAVGCGVLTEHLLSSQLPVSIEAAGARVQTESLREHWEDMGSRWRRGGLFIFGVGV